MILSSLYLRTNQGSGFFTRHLERRTVPGPESRSTIIFNGQCILCVQRERDKCAVSIYAPQQRSLFVWRTGCDAG